MNINNKDLVSLKLVLKGFLPEYEWPPDKINILALGLLHYGQYGLKPVSEEERDKLIKTLS